MSVSTVQISAGVLYSDLERKQSGIVDVSDELFSESTASLSIGGGLAIQMNKYKRWKCVFSTRFNRRPPPNAIYFADGESGRTLFAGVPVRPNDEGFLVNDFIFPIANELAFGSGLDYKVIQNDAIWLSLRAAPSVNLIFDGINRGIDSRSIPNGGARTFITASTNGGSIPLVQVRPMRFEMSNSLIAGIPLTARIDAIVIVQHDWQISPTYSVDLVGFSTWTGLQSPSRGEPRWTSIMGRLGVQIDLDGKN